MLLIIDALYIIKLDADKDYQNFDNTVLVPIALCLFKH